MRESADFHTNATPTFVGTRLRENPGRNPRRAPENTPWVRTMLQPLHPYGAVLNLDVIDFRNIEKLIDEWVAAIKIAATTLELDKKNFIKLVELSLEGSVKIGWDNTPADTKASILAGDSKSAIADLLGRLIKIHFIGDGYFEGSRAEKAREYAQALFSLELRSICAIDEYIYWFRKYFFQSRVAMEVAAPMFFAKICSPWREMLIQSYKVPEGQMDSVARRMSFLKDKLKDWCYQASIQKNMKRLRGIELQEHIVEKIRNFSDILKDKKHLQSFLGVVCNNLPKLSIPQDEDELVVYTDANDYRWAAMLMKKTTIGEEPYRYTRGLFTEQQAQVWHINEKEFFAVWKAFKKWPLFLLAKEFTLKVDNTNVKAFLKNKLESKIEKARIIRWQAECQYYCYNIVVIKSHENILADFLTRDGGI
ncbi:UNVERIFIED_CONTAM: hypothetical protein Sradi_1338100 [Sesamum radiatum]|uniref:Reverse transcriptase RNase H-like domain-containing protein n=1 Tax=Sesamum radiatum TaxID=300843 RepID=A0AAW2UVQ3_SESRA